MSLDISRILRDWPYEPGEVTVRRIRGDDGTQRIQLRLDLGLLQMELTGRPDGQKPHGCESLFEYHRKRLARYRRRKDSDEGFTLGGRDCELLRSEGVMYYHRYLASFVLGDYERVRIDTERNLRLFDFCQTYAKRETDRRVLDQYRPYVFMMHTRACANLALASDGAKSALRIVREGIEQVEEFYETLAEPQLARLTGEVAILKAMAEDIQTRVPTDPVHRLRNDLARAVREERYEDAARLRDSLRRKGAAETGLRDETDDSEQT